MTVTDTTALDQTEAIAIEIELAHAPEKVWRAITDAELLSEWLLPVLDLKLEPGGTFTFTAPPQPGWDGRVDCRFIESEANRKLRYSWSVGSMETVVTFTLNPTATGTKLTVVQSGFTPEQKRNFNGARYGWKMMSGKLIDVVARIA